MRGTGTVTKRARASGRAHWGYVFDAGKDENGKRRQVTKSGFKTEREAQVALEKAIQEHRGKRAATEEKLMPSFAEFHARWHEEVVKRQLGRKEAQESRKRAQYAI